MLLSLFPAYVVFCLAVMSPGPDFAMTVQNSLRFGARAGVLTALGIMCGNAIQIALINVGLGALIAHSLILFNILKYAAGAYLAYLGYKALRAKPVSLNDAPQGAAAPRNRDSFAQGFIANLLNPKATIFWLSYFAVVLRPDLPQLVLVEFLAVVLASVFLWFSAVAFFLSRTRVREAFLRLGHWLDRATGIVLIGFGVTVALARR